MFTLEQINQAHSKVKSGIDFPAYIHEIKELGVIAYETFVRDGHTVYIGKVRFKIATDPRFDNLPISDVADKERFKNDLKSHQLGNTNFPTFRLDCAASGVEKWVVNTNEMTCTYFDREGEVVLREVIPGQ